LRTTSNLRPGPLAPELAAALRDAPDDRAPLGAGWTRPLRISQLFPAAPARAVTLRAAFFLNGFADRPALAPFRLTVHHAEVLDCLASETAGASWGLAPGRRALRAVALCQALARVPCWLLTVGPPADTVRLLERTMEELACSQ